MKITLTYKTEIITPYKKNLNMWTISAFPWSCQKRGQKAKWHLFSKQSNPGSHSHVWLPGAEKAGVINRWGHFNGNFDELLEAE